MKFQRFSDLKKKKKDDWPEREYKQKQTDADRTGLERDADSIKGKLSKVNDRISDVRRMSATWKTNSTRRQRWGDNNVLEMKSVVNQKKNNSVKHFQQTQPSWRKNVTDGRES